MPQNRLIRHHLFDRLFHWLLAISIFILLFTGLLPQFDIDFNWVELHWITGIVLTVLVAIHIVRLQRFGPSEWINTFRFSDTVLL